MDQLGILCHPNLFDCKDVLASHGISGKLAGEYLGSYLACMNDQNIGFHPAKKWEKIFQWSPLRIISKGKIKIDHLLPERVIGPEEMPILVWWRRMRPQLKWDQPKTYKF